MSMRFIRVLGFLISIFVSDAGNAQSWKKIATFDGYICFSKFLDANIGFVGLGISPGLIHNGPAPIELYKTTNGGTSWKKVSIPTNFVGGGEIGDLIMVDSMNGWIAMASSAIIFNNKALWHTTDGGLTWNETQLVGSGTAVRITPTAMIVTDLLNNGHISTDGGNTFLNGLFSSTNCVDFVDSMHGVISDYRGQNWLYTSDGGLTWQNSTMTVESWSVLGVIGTSDFYAAPEGPTNGMPYSPQIFRSTDFGVTWESISALPYLVTGHIAGISEDMLFCQVSVDGAAHDSIYHGGFYCSSDKGLMWSSIGGPSAEHDTRFSVIQICDSIKVFGFDDKSPGSLFQYSIGRNGKSPNALFFPNISQITQSSCVPIDIIIPVDVNGCAILSAYIDSLWLTGSSAFRISDMRTAPRVLSSVDSILVSYAGTSGPDTSLLHLRYNLGSGAQDTTIQLIGILASPFLGAPSMLHRESASAYYGQLDSLTLGVDLSTQINLDSLWPSITSIQATYTWDSSVVSFASYLPPAGWLVSSLTSHGNAVDFSIQNVNSSATHPLNLGTALFRPRTSQQAASWVELPSLVLGIGGQAVSLCVSDNEDNHWAVKTLGVQSGVAEVPSSEQDITVYPNPAGDELFVQNTNSSEIQITIYDAIGKSVASRNVLPASTTSIGMGSLARGSYLCVSHIGDRIVTRKINKVQ
jgi:hypothetical protein